LIERGPRDREIELLLLAQKMVLVRELASNRLWVHSAR